MNKGKYWLSGFLLLVVLSTSVYFILNDNVRIDITPTYSTFKVMENGSWVISGTEYVNLFDGTTKMKANDRTLETVIGENNITTVTRIAYYKDNISTIEIYTFNPGSNDVELFPVSHSIQVINGQGKILQYEVQKLSYSGVTVSDISSPQEFGRRMKVEWESGNYYSKIYKTTLINEGKLTIKYKVNSSDFTKNVRLFDPPSAIVVTLVSPLNNSESFSSLITMYANATSDGFVNGTLYDNSTGTWGARNTTNINRTDVFGQQYLTSFSVTGYGDYQNGNTYAIGNTTVSYLHVCGLNSYWSTLGNLIAGFTYQNGTYIEYSIPVGGNVLICGNITNPNPLTNVSTILMRVFVGEGGGTRTTVMYNSTVYYYLYPNSTQVNFTNTYSTGSTNLWNTRFCDISGACNFSSSNYTTIYNPRYPQINYTSLTKSNNTYINQNFVYVKVNLPESAIFRNITYSLYNSTLYNNTTYTNYASSNYINWTSLSNGQYYYNVTTYNLYNLSNSTETRKIILDTIYPNISYAANSDASNSSANFLVKNNIFVNVSVTETNIANVTFILYNSTNVINTTVKTNIASYYNINWTNLNSSLFYFWNVTICDLAGNCNTTAERYYGNELILLEIDGFLENINVELGTDIDVNVSSNFDNIYVDIDHPSYGINYSSGKFETSFNLVINWFRKIIFSNGLIYQTLNFTAGFGTDQNITFNITSHQYDEIVNVSVNISGTNNPTNVAFYRTNSSEYDRVFTGNLTSDGYIFQNKLLDRTTTPNVYNESQYLQYSNNGTKILYFLLDDSAKLINFIINVTSYEYGFFFSDDFENDTYIDTVLSNASILGGRILPYGNNPFNFSYDNFSDSSINSTLWLYPVDYTYNVPGGEVGYNVVATTSESGNTLNNGELLSLTGGCGVDTVSTSDTRYLYTNNSWFDLSTIDAIDIEFSFDYDGREMALDEDVNNRDCQSVLNVKLGDISLWSVDSNNYGCEYGDSSSCSEYGTTQEDMRLVLTKQTNSNWKVEVFGTEYHHSTSDVSSCGDYDIYLNWTEGKRYNYYDSCTDTIQDISRIFYITPDYDSLQQLYTSNYAKSRFEEGPGCYGCDTISSIMRIHYLNNTRRSFQNSTIVSSSVFDSSYDVPEVTLRSRYNGAPTFYISGDNGDNWQNILSNVDTPIISAGRNLKWKANFNVGAGGYLTNVPYIDSINLTVQKSNVSNLTFDFGNDGVIDYTIGGNFTNDNGTVSVDLSNADISGAFSGTPSYAKTHLIPLVIGSSTAGSILIDNINLSYNPNPVYLNSTAIQNYLTNFGSGFTIIPFVVDGRGNNSKLNLTDLRFDYAGGSDVIEVLAHNAAYTQSVSRNITYYFSRWDYQFVPSKVSFLQFTPSSPTSKNVTPYGQTSTVSILNLTNYGYGTYKPVNLSVYLNDTLACVNLTMSLTNNKSQGVLVNESWIPLKSNITYLETNNVWMWADYQCNYSTWRYFDPYIYFRQCCEGCVCSEELI